MRLDRRGATQRRTADAAAYKVRVLKGLHELEATGELRQIARGVYQLKPGSPSAIETLAGLVDQASRLKEALASRDTNPRWLPVQEWYSLRDRFKDAALAIERELSQAGGKLDLPTVVRVIDGDRPPADRRFEVKFQARSSESLHPSTKSFIERAQHSRLNRPGPNRPDKFTWAIVRLPAKEAQAGPSRPPSPRSKARRNPNRRQEAP